MIEQETRSEIVKCQHSQGQDFILKSAFTVHVKCFEQSQGLDAKLYKNIPLHLPLMKEYCTVCEMCKFEH